MTDEPDLFVSGVDLDRGANTVHIYDRENPSEGHVKPGWFDSLCGMSFAKGTNAKSFRANRDAVSCGSCLRILDGRDA